MVLEGWSQYCKSRGGVLSVHVEAYTSRQAKDQVQEQLSDENLQRRLPIRAKTLATENRPFLDMFKMPISPYKLCRTLFIFISLRSSLLFLAPVQNSRSLGPSPDLSARSALPGLPWVLLVDETPLESRSRPRGYAKLREA